MIIKKTGIIIQARMTSKRFPGKVIAKLWDHPVITHVIQGCLEVPNVPVIVALHYGDAHTPIRDVVEDYFKDNERVKIYDLVGMYGENDVLARYYSAARKHSLDIIVRITADCPLIQPEPIIEVINAVKAGAPYCTNSYPKRTLPKGLDAEAFTFDTLRKAYQGAKGQDEREHVTPWMQKNTKYKSIQYDEDNSAMNLCVDYPWDIERLESAQVEPQ